MESVDSINAGGVWTPLMEAFIEFGLWVFLSFLDLYSNLKEKLGILSLEREINETMVRIHAFIEEMIEGWRWGHYCPIAKKKELTDC